MFKKLSAAAVIAACAAFPVTAYASGIGSAVGGVVSAGGEIVDGAFDAGRDIINGFTADGTTIGSGRSGLRDGSDTTTDDSLDTNPGDTTPDTDPGDTTPDTTPGDTTPDTNPGDTTPDTNPGGTTSDTTPDSTTSGTTSGDLVSSGNDNVANSPNTGATLGYTAVAAVLAAMGVMATAVRRKDD